MRTLFIACAAMGISYLLLAQTSVQPSSTTEAPALVGTATNGQTIVHSHQSEIFYRSNIYVWRDAVWVDNPQMQLKCELLTVEAPKLDSGKGKYNRATAETNVVIDWFDEKGTNHATADKAVYTYVLTNLAEPPAEMFQTNAFVVLSGNSVLSNTQGVYRADSFIWDRIHGTISSTNFKEGVINPNSANTPGLFDSQTPKNKTAPK
jgi:lipopolysaccharide export system protein LptA